MGTYWAHIMASAKEVLRQTIEQLNEAESQQALEFVQQLQQLNLALQVEPTRQSQTIVERLGGHPQYLLQNAPPDLSEREPRKQAIAAYLSHRHAKRQAQ